MNTRARTFALLLTLGVALPHAAFADQAPEDRLTDARMRMTAARAGFSSLLAQYRMTSLSADEAVARSLELRRRAEQLNVELDASRRVFQSAVARAYIDGPGTMVEAVLHARDLADLNALMPFVESNMSVRIRDAQALTARRARLEALTAEVSRRQAGAVVEEHRLSIVTAAISKRLARAEAAVTAAKADVEAARAKRALEGMSVAWTATKKSVDMTLYQRRKARGEQMFRDAAPFLGPRPRCDAPPGLHPTGATLSGKSSWYGAEFAGKGTASGAVYDPWRYTVAHRTLPFGLFLLIKSDGKCVLSLLNDRGPYIYDRILDLSAASAKAVDLSGVEHVDAVIFIRD